MSSVVPEGWEVKRLGELCNSVRGVSYKPDDLYSIKSDSTATLLRSNNIQSGQLIFNNVQFVDRRKVKERQIVRTGDIAICMSNGSKRLVGKNGIFPQTHQSDILTVGAFCSIIRTKEGGNETFISQVLKSDEFFKQVEFSLAGSAINNLKDGDVEDYLFSFPPLPEQKKIASILTSVDEVIENTQKQIDKLQDLKKATMNELLTKGIGHTEFKDSELGRIPEGWVLAEFGDYFPKLSSGMTPSRNKPEYFNGNIPWVTSGELDYNVITSTRETISEQAVKDTNLKIYPPGTIFIAITGLEAAGTRGRCAILGVPSTVNQSCMAFPVNPNIDSSFFFQNYLLRGEEYAFKYSQGTKQQSFNAEIVKKLPIRIAPLPEQKKIASILTSMDKNIEEKQRKLSQTQSLKKSLMQDLLTGKVRVTVN